MNRMNRLLFSILLLSLNSLLQASDWSQSNLDVVDKFAIPAYEKLKGANDQLLKTSTYFCENVNEKNFDALKNSFHQSMDAWQSVQILRSGPAMDFMRFYRMEMWPDRSNAATKHLRKLIKEANPDNLNPEKFANASTAIQGLSAMERMLYAKKVVADDFQTESTANFKCDLIVAISLNVQVLSNELLKAWQREYRETINKPGKDNDFFETDKAVAAQFLNNLNTQLQVILEQKFKRPIEDDRFRLTRAESWRSQRSLRNITLNLLASKKLYDIGFTSNIADQNLLKKQQGLFDHAITLSKELALPLQVAHDKHPKKLQQWIHSIGLLKASIYSELPLAIDIPLGFNSLDGD